MYGENEFGTCPYNSDHKIVLYRMPGHIIKCRKTYKGPPLDQCIYNATHLIPFGTMDQHLENCRDFRSFNSCAFEKIAERSMAPY